MNKAYSILPVICGKSAAVLLAASILFPLSAKAQSEDDFYSDGSSQIQTEESATPNHFADDAFLRRHSQQDEVKQLLANSSSRIQRNLVMYANMFGNAGSGDNAPFWFTSNRQGLSPVNNASILLDLGLDGSMYLPSNFHFSYGMEVATGIKYQSDFYLQQFYVEAGYKWFDLSIGAKSRWGELVNPSLSSGALTWSGNSRPIPQIRLEVPEFTRLGILGRLFSLKGHIAYGWYQDSEWRRERASIYSNPPQYTDKILHHSKSFFLKVGDTKRFPLELTLGLEMYAQFGGTRHNMRTWSSDPIIGEYEFPHDFKAYLQAFLPVNKAGEQTKENGNTFGSWHIAFDLTMKQWKYRLYYEHFFEDHSSMLGIERKADLNGNMSFISYGLRRNWLDGLFGIEVNAPEGLPFSNIVFEVLNTRGQCGSVLRYQMKEIIEGVDGRDNTYVHEYYKSYSNFGYNNGSPILVSPLYNEDGDLSLKSNRALSFHLGIDGNITERISYRVMVTHTSHWGTYDYPLPEREEITSALVECFYKFKGSHGWKLGLSLAGDFDTGGLTGNNRGCMISVSKNWKML